MNDAWSKKRFALLAIALAATLAAACILANLIRARGFGYLGITHIHSTDAKPYYIAVSSDGKQLATVHSEISGNQTIAVVDVHDAQSGSEMRSFPLPTVDWEQSKTQYYLTKRLAYCDDGKYLVAASGLDVVDVLDAHTFQLHAAFSLSNLEVHPDGATAAKPFASINFLSRVEFDCAANNATLALAFWGDLGAISLKLFDLEKGVEIADLAGIYRHGVNGIYRSYRGDGMAISPDGSKLALVTWGESSSGGSGVDLLDTGTGAFLNRTSLGDRFEVPHELSFAGSGALVIGEVACQPNGACDPRKPRSGRTLRVWDFGGEGSLKTLGWPGAETYRSFGSSADGSVVFSYTGQESNCQSCNSNYGELKIKDPRFVVWNLTTGKPVARSPRLRIEPHNCPWLTLGSCTSFDQQPVFAMSSNGKTIAAIWPTTDFPPAKNAIPTDEIEVFHLP